MHVCVEGDLEWKGKYLLLFSSSVGYFIEPTIYETSNPKDKLMEEVRTSMYLVMTYYVYACNTIRPGYIMCVLVTL